MNMIENAVTSLEGNEPKDIPEKADVVVWKHGETIGLTGNCVLSNLSRLL